MKQEKSKTGYGWKAFSLFLAIVIVLAGILFGIFYMTGDISFRDKEQETVAVTEEGDELASGDIVPMQNMTFATAKSLTTESDARVTIKATVMPLQAATELSWTVTFNDPASKWATGKTVTDYVTVTPSASTLTATVQCLQPFGEQIIVTSSADKFEGVTASCTVDFGQRIKTVIYTGYNGGDMNELSYITWSGGYHDERTVSFTVQFYEYTLPSALFDSAGGKVPFCVNSKAEHLPEDDGVVFSVSTAYHEPLRWTDGQASASFSLSDITADGSSLAELTEEQEQELCTWLNRYAGESDIYALKLSLSTLYGNYTVEVPLRLNPEFFPVTVDVALDSAGISI